MKFRKKNPWEEPEDLLLQTSVQEQTSVICDGRFPPQRIWNLHPCFLSVCHWYLGGSIPQARRSIHEETHCLQKTLGYFFFPKCGSRGSGLCWKCLRFETVFKRCHTNSNPPNARAGTLAPGTLQCGGWHKQHFGTSGKYAGCVRLRSDTWSAGEKQELSDLAMWPWVEGWAFPRTTDWPTYVDRHACVYFATYNTYIWTH